MLPKIHRLRSAAEFSATVRSGARSGRRNVVLYARIRPKSRSTEPSRFGFIVSKAVGNAVTRNLVKRRLRAVAVKRLPDVGFGYDIVVRALPAAAEASWSDLSSDMRLALDKSCRQAEKRAGEYLRKGNCHG